MPSSKVEIESQHLLSAQINFIHKLMEQATNSVTYPNAVPPQFTPHTSSPSSSMATVVENTIDVAPQPTMPLATVMHKSSQMFPTFNAVSNSNTSPTDAFAYYGAYFQIQSLLNNANEQQLQQISNLNPQTPPNDCNFDGISFVEDLRKSQLLREKEQQESMISAMLAANTAAINANANGLPRYAQNFPMVDIEPKYRLKRQTLSSQSLLSSIGNERSVSIRSEGTTSSSSPISISPNFVGGASASISAPNTVLSTSADHITSSHNNGMRTAEAAFFPHSSPVTPQVNYAAKNNFAVTETAVEMASGEMLVPSNDKEGWCRNKKYIQIVKKGYRCTVCNKIYGRYNSVSYHVTIYHRNPPIRCEEDGCQFTTREARYIHFHKYYRHQIPLPESIDLASRKCPLMRCKHVSKSPAMLEKHMQRHVVDCLRDGVYECAECCDAKAGDDGFKAVTYEQMYDHLRTVHSFTVPKLPCDGTLSPTDELSSMHVGIKHESVDNLQNEELVKHVFGAPDCRRAKRSTKSPPNFSCNHCHYRGRTLSNLEQHKVVKHCYTSKTNDAKKISTDLKSYAAMPLPNNDVSMEDLTNFTNNNLYLMQQQQYQQQLQKLQELQLLQKNSIEFSSTTKTTTGLPTTAATTTTGLSGLQNYLSAIPNTNPVLTGLTNIIGNNNIVNNNNNNVMANMNFIQQIRTQPDHFLQAFEQFLSAQKALFANSSG